MYAHVNTWRMNEHGASTDDTTAREVGTRLSQQPGFVSYTLVRTDPREVVAITIFDSRDHMDESMDAVAAFVEERVAPLAAGEPTRRRGDVLYHTSA